MRLSAPSICALESLPYWGWAPTPSSVGEFELGINALWYEKRTTYTWHWCSRAKRVKGPFSFAFLVKFQLERWSLRHIRSESELPVCRVFARPARTLDCRGMARWMKAPKKSRSHPAWRSQANAPAAKLPRDQTAALLEQSPLYW